MTKITPEMQARWAKEQQKAKTALIVIISLVAGLGLGFIILLAAANAVEPDVKSQGLGITPDEFEERFLDAPLLSRENIVDFTSKDEYDEDGTHYIEYVVGNNNRIRAVVLDSGKIYSISASLWLNTDDRIDQSVAVWAALNDAITGELLLDEMSDMAFNISDNYASHSEIFVDDIHIELRPHAGSDGLFDGSMTVHYTKAQ